MNTLYEIDRSKKSGSMTTTDLTEKMSENLQETPVKGSNSNSSQRNLDRADRASLLGTDPE